MADIHGGVPSSQQSQSNAIRRRKRGRSMGSLVSATAMRLPNDMATLPAVYVQPQSNDSHDTKFKGFVQNEHSNVMSKALRTLKMHRENAENPEVESLREELQSLKDDGKLREKTNKTLQMQMNQMQQQWKNKMNEMEAQMGSTIPNKSGLPDLYVIPSAPTESATMTQEVTQEADSTESMVNSAEQAFGEMKREIGNLSDNLKSTEIAKLRAKLETKKQTIKRIVEVRKSDEKALVDLKLQVESIKMQTSERAKKAKEERERYQAKIEEMTESLEKEKSSYSKLWEELDKVAKGKYEVTVVNQHIQREKEHIEHEYNTAQNIATKLRAVLLQNEDESGDETEFAVRRLTMMAKQCQKMMLQKLSCLEDQKIAIMKARRLEQANIRANINKDKKISMALIGEKECDRVIKMAEIAKLEPEVLLAQTVAERQQEIDRLGAIIKNKNGSLVNLQQTIKNLKEGGDCLLYKLKSMKEEQEKLKTTNEQGVIHLADALKQERMAIVNLKEGSETMHSRVKLTEHEISELHEQNNNYQVEIERLNAELTAKELARESDQIMIYDLKSQMQSIQKDVTKRTRVGRGRYEVQISTLKKMLKEEREARNWMGQMQLESKEKECQELKEEVGQKQKEIDRLTVLFSILEGKYMVLRQYKESLERQNRKYSTSQSQSDDESLD